MPDNFDTIHKGVKKSAVLTVDISTVGDTIKLYAFDKRDPSDPGTLLGSAEGKPEGEEIVFSMLDTNLLDEDAEYVIEAWVNPDSSERKCVHPEDGQIHYLIIKDRRKIV